MLQLLVVILVSPMGMFSALAVRGFIYGAILVSDCEECGFNDLGKLLFGGLLAAIVVGVAVPLVLRRVKKGSPDESHFVSINVTGAEKRTDAR